jgi:hypothetical protein
MTAMLVGTLVGLAVLVWSAAAALARKPALGTRGAGDGEPSGWAGGSGGASARRPRLLTWLDARRRRRQVEHAEAEALELLDGLVPALRAGLPPLGALRLVTSRRRSGNASQPSTAADPPAEEPSTAVGEPRPPEPTVPSSRPDRLPRAGRPSGTGRGVLARELDGPVFGPQRRVDRSGWTRWDEPVAGRRMPDEADHPDRSAFVSAPSDPAQPARSEALTWASLEAAAARGDPLTPAWSAYAAAVDSDDLRLVAAAWSLCETLGAPLAPTVATVAELVRRRRAVRHRVAAVLAGPEATMRVLTALPLSGPLVAVAVGVAPSELYAGAAAWISLVAGLALLLVGRAWAARLVRIVTLERPSRHFLRRRKGSRARR